MREILNELDESDAEHPDAWLTHESGWSLSVFESGLIVWENVEEDCSPRHMRNVSRDKALALWMKLAEGRIAEIDDEAWHPGYG